MIILFVESFPESLRSEDRNLLQMQGADENGGRGIEEVGG